MSTHVSKLSNYVNLSQFMSIYVNTCQFMSILSQYTYVTLFLFFVNLTQVKDLLPLFSWHLFPDFVSNEMSMFHNSEIVVV